MATGSQQVQQLEKYGEDGLDYLNQSQLIRKYIIRKYSGGKGSAMTIRSSLNHFGLFILRKKAKGEDTLDSYISGINEPYDLLQEYSTNLQQKNTKPNQVRQLVKAAKKFLRVSGSSSDIICSNNTRFSSLSAIPNGFRASSSLKIHTGSRSMEVITQLAPRREGED